ncbi:MAG TPA: cytochrome c oxidase subunit II [Pseudomonadaceae bacterium]|nr:cytochrome c oxidase subunit II [Pseudomonadaceae bacterium]
MKYTLDLEGHEADRSVPQRVAARTAIFAPLLLAACSGPYSTLDPAGPAAHSAAALWWGMSIFAGLVLLTVVLLWFHASRRGGSHRDEGSMDKSGDARRGRHWILGGGVILPVSSIAVLLYFGIPAGQRMLPVFGDEAEVLRVDVTAHQWWWETSYPDLGLQLINELHIPVDVPVEIHLRASDVVHSFWVPRLGGKLDAIPGHTNVLRLESDTPGLHHGQCAEFCGLLHARMHFTVQVHTAADFERWQQEALAHE